MKDDTAANPHDRPFVSLMRIDLNLEFEEGLKSAFQQTDRMFGTNANLEGIWVSEG
jgi:hypothetical protein